MATTRLASRAHGGGSQTVWLVPTPLSAPRALRAPTLRGPPAPGASRPGTPLLPTPPPRVPGTTAAVLGRRRRVSQTSAVTKDATTARADATAQDDAAGAGGIAGVEALVGPGGVAGAIAYSAGSAGPAGGGGCTPGSTAPVPGPRPAQASSLRAPLHSHPEVPAFRLMADPASARAFQSPRVPPRPERHTRCSCPTLRSPSFAPATSAHVLRPLPRPAGWLLSRCPRRLPRPARCLLTSPRPSRTAPSGGWDLVDAVRALRVAWPGAWGDR